MRPVELTQKIVDEAARLVPVTMYIETVADLIGVHRVTLRRWLNAGGKEQRRRERGKPADPKFDLHCALCIGVKKALAGAERDLLASIQAAGVEAWQAHAWMLERRWLDRWSLQRGEVRELKRRLGELEKGHGAKPTEGAGRASRKRPTERESVA